MAGEPTRESPEAFRERRRSTWNARTVEQLRSLQSPGEPDLVGELVDTIRDDTAALVRELRERAAVGDLPAVRAIAHRIRGGALNLGAEKLARSAAELERAALDGARDRVDALVPEVVSERERFLARAAAR